MNTKITLLILALFVSVNFSFAQQDEECMEQLSIFDTYRKQKKYDEAYTPWKTVREKCPKYSRAIYAYGDDILEHKIKNSTGAEQLAYVKDLMLVYEQYNQYFASKFPKGKMLSEKAELAYKYKEELGLSNKAVYDIFDDAFASDKANFKGAKGLYAYFSLMVDMFDAKEVEAQKMFDKYDDVKEHIESIIADFTNKLNKYAAKEEADETLTKKESNYKEYYESSIAAFEDKVLPSMDQKLGDRANCSVLIPLYNSNFDANKNDPVWLQRAMNRMYAKGCKEDPLFVKLVKQKYSLQPDADTAYYLYLLTGEQKYFDETLRLESDPLKKAKLYYKLAGDFKSKGSYGKARQYYMEALKLNPSSGAPYLKIAAMYASSANNCGNTNFDKRAVFWLAEQTAARAGRVDGRLKSASSQTAASYRGKAPSKSEIFNSGKAGKPLKIGCWIQRTITVPSL